MNSALVAFAIKAYSSTNHLYDGHPYAVHLALTAYYAQKYIHLIPEKRRSDIISSAWLHDTIEDARLTYNDVLKVSNEFIADIVYALTNEKGKIRSERANDKYYEGIKNNSFAIYVKLCDRLANARYSVDSKSTMHETYRKEHTRFLNSLGLNDNAYYKDMVAELNLILSL